jgi:predicted nucleotidyltransferase
MAIFGHTMSYNGHINDLATLARKLGVNERTLRRAFNEGTIRGARLSPRRLKLPVIEKEYLLDHWPLLSQLRQVLRTEPNVTFALLFGSIARGDDTEESDVDLLVAARDPAAFDRFRLAVKVEEALDREVDVIAMEDAHGSPLLLAEAAREGRVIVDREGLWPGFSSERKRLERRAQAQYRARKRKVFGEAPTRAMS